MCRFTRIFWTQCGHHTLSDTPEHTQLCKSARDSDAEIRQGFDRAPAFCHPLPEDIEELGTKYRDSDRIVQTNCLHTFCDMCKDNLDISPEPRGAGVEIEKPVEQFDAYSDDDRMDLAKWHDLHLSDTKKTELAVQELKELLRIDRETIMKAIASVRNDTIRTALQDPDSRQRWILFRKTHQEAAGLLAVTANYMDMQMPRKFVNDLVECVQNKLYQAELRLDIFAALLRDLSSYATDQKAYEAAINLHADKLATRLGYQVMPDADEFAHLTVEMPQHIQDTLATKERVRRRSIQDHSSRARADRYIPRSAFGLGKKKNTLAIDLERAWNPPPGQTRDLPVLRNLREHVDIAYDGELETRDTLGPMGVGPWTEEHVLAQQEVLGGNHMLGRGDAFDDSEDTLVGSPDRQLQGGESAGAEEHTVSKTATFMGVPLEDTDSEVSDGDDVARGRVADQQDAGRQEAVKTEKAVGRRDGNGRFLKRRKCSA